MTANQIAEERFLKMNDEKKLVNFDDLKPKFRYYRDKKNQRIALIASFGPGIIGWARWNTKNKFNLNFALKLALGRAIINYIRGNTCIGKYRKEAIDLTSGDCITTNGLLRSKCPHFLKDLYMYMYERSIKEI